MQRLKELIEYEHENTNVDFKLIEYKKINFAHFLKDVIAMANANTKDDKFIVFGMKPKADGDRYIIGIDANDFTDSAIYQQLVSENIEPELEIDYFPYQYEGKVLGILIIKSCNNRPYLMKKSYNSDKGKALDKGEGFIRLGTTQRRLIRSDYDLFYKSANTADAEITVNGAKENFEADVYFQREIVFYELDSPFPSTHFTSIMENFVRMNERFSPLFKSYQKDEINKSLVKLEFRLKNIGSVALENIKVNFNFKGNHLGLTDTNIVVRNRIETIAAIHRNDLNRVDFKLINNENMTLDFNQRLVVGGDYYTTRAFYIVTDKKVDTNIEISWELLSKTLKKSGKLQVVLHPKIQDLRRRIVVESVLDVKKEYSEIKDWIEEVE